MCSVFQLKTVTLFVCLCLKPSDKQSVGGSVRWSNGWLISFRSVFLDFKFNKISIACRILF